MTNLLNNIYLWSALLGWFVAQFLKIIVTCVKDRKFSLKIFFKMLMASGGMPSSHSASACALAASIAVVEGIDSALFAIACVFAFIVMYDAQGVRHETGVQARILNKISTDLSTGKTKYIDRDLKELVGHTPLQVLAGAILGILIGALLPFKFI